MKLYKLGLISSIALSFSGLNASAQVAGDWGSVSSLSVALTYSYTVPGNVAKDATGKPTVPATPSVEEEYAVITRNAAGVETKRVETEEFITKASQTFKYGNAEIIKELVDDEVLPKKGKAPFVAGWSLVVVAKVADDEDDDGIEDDEDEDDDNDGIEDDADLDDDDDGINDEDDDDDIDNDGIYDDADADDDNDGINDSVDTDDDGDGTPDAADTDEDNDGIPDEEDDGDLDNDGVEDEDELEETVYARHTDKTMVELDGITFNIAGQEDEDDYEDEDEGDDDFDNDGIDDEVDTDDDDDGILDGVDEDDDNDNINDEDDLDDDQDGINDDEEDDDDFDNDGVDNEDDLDDDNDGTPDATDLDDDDDGLDDDLDFDDDNDGIDDEEEAEADDEDDGDSDNDGTLDDLDLDDDNDGVADDDDEDDDNDGSPDSEEGDSLTGAALARNAKEVKTTTTSSTGVKTVVRTLADTFSFKAEGYGEARGETFRGLYSETGSKVVIKVEKIGNQTIETDVLLTGAAKLEKIIGSTSAPLAEDAIYGGVIEGSMSTSAAVLTDMNLYLED